MSEGHLVLEVKSCPICDEKETITVILMMTSDGHSSANFLCEDCGCQYDEEGKEL